MNLIRRSAPLMLEKLGCDAIVYTELRNVGIQVWFFSSANFRIWAHADFSFWSSIDLMIIVIFRTLGCIVMYTGTVQAGKQVQQIERIVNFSPILFPLEEESCWKWKKNLHLLVKNMCTKIILKTARETGKKGKGAEYVH
ncbi:hypothetical protein MKW98_007433 [Papaver atlanticum]|uniref:Uncharacterized protein n=1 Tax=Papaver atlanticum TaxID=357466 RepID=A0AAD4XBK8_9MAGN|nr:hypothetical protein MKW98_007433 [Papaver atlanticum]